MEWVVWLVAERKQQLSGPGKALWHAGGCCRDVPGVRHVNPSYYARRCIENALEGDQRV